MHSRYFYALAGTAVMTLLLVLLLAGGSAGQTDPPASGDWTVSDTTVVTDRNVDLHGDLVVTATGSLTLENVTLKIFVASPGEHGIEVEAGGTLTLRDGDGQASTTADATSVTAQPANRAYYFIVRADATLRITNSLITRCGYVPSVGKERQGLYIATDDAIITGTSFDDCLQGLVVEDGTAIAIDSTFTNSTYNGVLGEDADVTLRGCIMADNGYEGARFFRGDAVLDGCQVLNNRDGIFIRTGCNATINNTIVKGNRDGIFMELDPVVEVLGCTFQANTQDAISAKDRVTLTLRDTLLGGNTRSGIKALNGIVITSSGNTIRNNVYGVQLNMNSRMTSVGDTFRGNTNCAIYLKSTSSLVIIEGTLTGNVVGIKGEGTSSVEAWATTMEECTFEGYKLTDTDLDLYDGRILNCTGGGVVPDTDSVTRWFVNTGNSSALVNADSEFTHNILVWGDLTLDDVTVGFHSGSTNYGISCQGGYQDWSNVTFRNEGSTGGVIFRIQGTATGRAWFVTLDDAYTSAPNDHPIIEVPFELHRCTFRNSLYGLYVAHKDVVIDRCTFSGNTRGVEVDTATVRFDNCTFSGNSVWDVHVTDSGHAALVNCSFDPAKVGLGGASDEWSAWWTVHVKVSFPTGQRVSGADVTVRDRENVVVNSGTTGPSGYLHDIPVLEHVTTQAARDDRGPHLFRADFGTSWGGGYVNVTSHLWVDINVTDPYPPTIELTSHSDGDHISDPVLVLRGTASDAGSGLYRVEARIATQGWQTVTGLEDWEWTTTLSWDGTFPFSIRARDNALNEVIYHFNLTLDTEAPDIDLQVPPTPGNNSLVGSADVSIVGYTDDPSVTVTANGVNATMNGTLFTIDLTLVDGLNTITIHAVDLAGNEATLVWVLNADLEAPPLTLDEPKDGAVLNMTTVTIEGTTSPYGDVYYRVVEVSNVWSLLTASGTGYFTKEVNRLKQGTNTVEVMVRDAAMNEIVITHLITVDTVRPELLTTVPENGAYVRLRTLNITGNYTEPISSLMVGSIEATVDGANFSIEVELGDGLNNVRLIAKDMVGNVGAITIRFYLDTTPPGLDLPGFTWNSEEGVFEPKGTNKRFFVLSGTTEMGALLFIDGWRYEVDDLGKFAAELDLEEDGVNVLEVLVRDRAGNEFATTVTLVLDTNTPQFQVDTPKDQFRTDKDYVRVTGTVTKGDTVTVGENSVVSEDGTFDIKVSLDDALNLLVITASDDAGNEVSVERLVFMVEDTEGLTGYEFLDENCQSLLVVIVIVIIALGIVLAFAWKQDDMMDRREKRLEGVLEEEHIELDRPHIEPTAGYLEYDPTSETGRRPEFEEGQDEDFVSMADFQREMERRDQ